MNKKKFNRREWSQLMLAGAAGILLPPSLSANNIYSPSFVLGVQSYSLRDRSREEAIQMLKELGITSVELWQGHIEPREHQWTRFSTPEEVKAKQEALVKWRQQVDLKEFDKISKQFKKAGIKVQAYAANMNDATSDHDMELSFKIAKALGTDTLTTSATITSMKRIDGFAQKYKTKVGMHNHSNVHRPNDFSTPESFSRAMEGCSSYTRINLDIGHFVAANLDPVEFIRNNHEKIVCLHIKDRKKDQGDNVPFGEGDTPIREVLELVRDNKWPIPANIEYEYGGDTKTELRKCIQYCRNIVQAKI
ncbi:MAG: sugar phosphate isomerase/epimerase [Chitinophagaceae bacterium]|nr:sugar phosphate isomerase/epimerase [Chitinophagaceae bacterium]MCW5925610.1 sugar phosphate isomerase/epimerase [Chitinophagaceae bacterium]